MVLENHTKLCVTELEVLKIIFFATKLRKASHIFLHLGRKKNALVSGNADDEKNLHPGGHKFIFFKSFSGDIIFSSLVCFTFLYSWGFFACWFVFLNQKFIFWYTFGYEGGWVIRNFSPARNAETRLLVLTLLKNLFIVFSEFVL